MLSDLFASCPNLKEIVDSESPNWGKRSNWDVEITFPARNGFNRIRIDNSSEFISSHILTSVGLFQLDKERFTKVSVVNPSLHFRNDLLVAISGMVCGAPAMRVSGGPLAIVDDENRGQLASEYFGIFGERDSILGTKRRVCEIETHWDRTFSY